MTDESNQQTDEATIEKVRARAAVRLVERQFSLAIIIIGVVGGMALVTAGALGPERTRGMMVGLGVSSVLASLVLALLVSLRGERSTYANIMPQGAPTTPIPPWLWSLGDAMFLRRPPEPVGPPPPHDEQAAIYRHKSLQRLGDLVGALGSRANFALGAGLIFSFGGVLILGWPLITGAAAPSADPILYALHYLPRLSITIIVELVAFFFLKTYARTLTDIRYVQNEFTNVEMKFIGLHTSIDQQLPDITKKALLALINTERNHILEKGQTSFELERERYDNEGNKATLDAVSDMVRGARKPEPPSAD